MTTRTPPGYRPWPPVRSPRPTRSNFGRKLVNTFAGKDGAIGFVAVIGSILFVTMMAVRVFIAWQAGLLG